MKAYLETMRPGLASVSLASSAEEAVSRNPDVVAISAVSQDFNVARRIASYARQHSNAFVVLGGQHISALTETLPAEVDAGVVGEGEQTFLELVECLHANRQPGPRELGEIAGLVCRKEDGSLALTRRRELIGDLDTLPIPDRLLRLSHQQSPYMFSSRGCPYAWRFCASSAYWRRCRFHSPARVVDEMDLVLRLFPASNHVVFWDDLFVADRARLRRIVELAASRRITSRATVTCTVRANLVDDELCELLKRLGVISVSFGAESGSDRVLKLLKSGVTVEANQRALDKLSSHGLKPSCSFIVGTPGETEAELEATYEFIRRNTSDGKITFYDVNILTPMPGSPIWDDAARMGLVNPDMNRDELRYLAVRANSTVDTQRWADPRRSNGSAYMNEASVPEARLLEIIVEREAELEGIRGAMSEAAYAPVTTSGHSPDTASVSACAGAAEVVSRLQRAGNPLALSGLMYLPGRRSHLDIGSNTGATLRGLNPRQITCIEQYGPAVRELRKRFGRVLEGDACQAVEALADAGERFDTVTALDFVEHLEKADGEKLLDRLDRLACKQIVLFVPLETDEVVRSEAYQSQMRDGKHLIAPGQELLQEHRSRWQPAEFSARGYDIVTLKDFHFPGFGAYFAVKHFSAADRAEWARAAQAYAECGSSGSAPSPRQTRQNGQGKGSLYYTNSRPEIVSLVPRTTRNVLEIGCAAGMVGEKLKATLGCRVTAIELLPEMASKAAGRLDRVVAGDVETLDLDAVLGEERFDCLIMGDVLEHLRDPWTALKRLRTHLSDDATLIVGIPNVGHISVIDALIHGDWDYAEEGLLDKTHLRFFTRKSVVRLLAEAGFTAQSLRPISTKMPAELQQASAPVCLKVGKLGITGLSRDELTDLFAYQYVVTATVAAIANGVGSTRDSESRTAASGDESVDGGQAVYSVVVVTYNSASTIRDCLVSVAAAADRSPLEVIVVDNASADGTVAEVRGLASEHPSLRLSLIENQENAGFSRGTNIGIRASKGRFVVLLNPDTVVSAGSFDRMGQHAVQGVGAVGPTSDYVAGLQKCGLHLRTSLPASANVEAIANALAQENDRCACETKLLIGFCMLVPRDVFDAVGLLDENLFLGNDDLELSWRLRTQGYRLLVAQDAFVHHVGQVSFGSESSSKTSRLVRESTDALARKLARHYGWGQVPAPQELWGMDWFKPSMPDLFGASSDAADRGAGDLTAPASSIIILCRNQLEYTRQCVDSIQLNTPEPHELILVDNGSTDDTSEYLTSLAERHANVTVIRNAENLGYAGGNNLGIAAATGNVVVLLNNDVIVTSGWLGRLRRVLDENPAVGIVGPRTNVVAGPQLVKDVGYSNLEQLDAFSDEWSRTHVGPPTQLIRAIGFCMAIRRGVIDKIGGLDPRFYPGNFEDDDIAIRARLAGFDVVMTDSVYVHHYGSRTFAGEKMDYTAVMRENWVRFLAKWGLPPDRQMESGYSLPEVRVSGFDPGKHSVPLDDHKMSVRKRLDSAVALESAGDLEGALRDFVAAAEMNQRVPAITFAVGRVAMAAGKPRAAAPWLMKTTELAPKEELPHALLGLALQALGEVEAGGEQLRVAAELDPNNARIVAAAAV